MDPAALKQSIDEWALFYRDSRTSLIPRAHHPIPKRGIAAALLGVRRSGKTFQAIEMSLAVPAESVLYYNFEDPIFLGDPAVSTLDLLLSTASEFRSDPIELLVLDEIQNVRGWERWLRKLIDQKRFQIIVTGSSAKLLSRELATALTGRTITYQVWPLSYTEYLQFTGRAVRSVNAHRSAFRRFLMWGGFPEVALLENERERNVLLRSYLDDIVLKDVISRHEIRNKRALDTLLVYYLTNLSSLHSISSLKKAFSLSADLISDYTDALCDAFALFRVPRYDFNLKRQSRDPDKIFVIDNGLRNVGCRSANDDTGKLLENLVHMELRRRGGELFYFHEDFEVDFVVTDRYRPTKIVQVCADMGSADTRKRELRAVEECMKALKIRKAEIVTMDRSENISVAGGKIRVIAGFEWLTEKVNSRNRP